MLIANKVQDKGQSVYEPVTFTTYPVDHLIFKEIYDPFLCEQLKSPIVVESNYQLKKIVGYGATSVVFKATRMHSIDKKTHFKEKVAVKKVKDIFANQPTAQRLLRELKLLRLLKSHPNVSLLPDSDMVLDRESCVNHAAA